jgi:GNAT superfamily N-acetyltransferase
MRIRDATPGDVGFLVELVPSFSAFGLPPWRDREAFDAAVERDLRAALGSGAAVLVAEDDDGTPLGFVHLHPVHDFSGGERAHVSDVAVAEHAQGRGVGRLLVEAAEAWAREHGYGLIGLTAMATNASALAFYDRLGFGPDTVTLVKPLRPPEAGRR